MLPTPAALTAARAIKADVLRGEEPVEMVPYEDWLKPTEDGSPRRIDAACVAKYADDEYEAWNRVPEGVTEYEHNFDERLHAWISEISVEDLARVIDKAPERNHGSGSVRPFFFTKWQRLNIGFFADVPFSYSSSIKVSTHDLRTLAYPRSHGGPQRAEAFDSYAGVLKGSIPKVIISNLNVGAGKTATALSQAFAYAADGTFEKSVSLYRSKALCEIVNVTLDLPVARVILVASSGFVFSHWQQTLEGLLPEFRRMAPGTDVHVWTDMRASHSPERAAELSGIVFWLIPMEHVDKVRKKHPSVAFLCMITDEMTCQVKGSKFKSRFSPVLHVICPQATPQALCEVTKSKASNWLKTEMDGEFLAPSKICDYISRRMFGEAQKAIDQKCKFDMMTVGPFRKYVGIDLRSIVWKGFIVTFVPSARSTLASFLNSSNADLLPADFPNTMRHKLHTARLDAASMTALNEYFNGATTCTIQGLLTVLKDLKTMPRFPGDEAKTGEEHPTIKKVADRLREFSIECPICYSPPSGGMANVAICSGCGYCMCNACSASNLSVRNSCPFCRKSIPTHVPRPPSLPAPAASQQDEVPEAMDLPDDIHAALALVTHAHKSQLYNLVGVLRTFKAAGKRRILVIIEPPYNGHTEVKVSDVVKHLHEEVNMEIAHSHAGGRGGEFLKTKNRFDDDTDPMPMALICVAAPGEAGILVGTDLSRADAVTFVGKVEDKKAIQAWGRVFRPDASRNNSEYIPCVQIYSR